MTLICQSMGVMVIIFTTLGTSSSEQSDSEGMSVGDGDIDDREPPNVAQVHAAPPGPHGML